MTENFLEKLFEHNNWANLRMIQACSRLSDEQLDAEPRSVTKGSIRRTLVHLVSSQYSYLRTLTLPLEERINPITVAFADLEESARRSGEGLLALARGERKPFNTPVQTLMVGALAKLPRHSSQYQSDQSQSWRIVCPLIHSTARPVALLLPPEGVRL